MLRYKNKKDLTTKEWIKIAAPFKEFVPGDYVYFSALVNTTEKIWVIKRESKRNTKRPLDTYYILEGYFTGETAYVSSSFISPKGVFFDDTLF